MALPIVELDFDYTVYADLDTADEYLGGSSHASTWDTLDDDQKGRYLVTASRLLNRQAWKGTKTVAGQALAFPRTGMNIIPEPVVDAEGLPIDVVNASIELALAIADGSEVQNQQTGAERIHSMSAGSVSITNFRGVDIATRFPQIVHELLRPFIGGTSDTTFGVAKATGVDGETIFPIELGYNTGGM